MFVIKAELVALHEDFGGYVTYVFRNLEASSWYNKYVMITRLPNWEAEFLKIGDIGYVEYKEVIAGTDTWWDRVSGERVPYKYDNLIFWKFVPIKEKLTITV